MLKFIKKFLKDEATSGIILLCSALLAMIVVNSTFAPWYHQLLETPIPFLIGQKPLLFWINDGLMAVFFFLIGLEIKREVVAGHLMLPANRILPGVATLAGVLFPALFYLALNHQDPVAVRGWAIPTATDIAFALGILALVGKKVPYSLKVFLMTIAVLDDLMAVLIIAFFYTHSLSWIFMGFSALVLCGFGILNVLKLRSIPLYILLSILLWISVLQSGIHPTVAGILAAWMIPYGITAKNKTNPLLVIEQFLHPWVGYLIVPLFAFANAGISFQTIVWSSLFNALPLGIMGGLVLGKSCGVFLGTGLTVKLGWARLPENATWGSIVGISLLCGIGFTMSIFIATLAFEGQAVNTDIPRLSVLLASLFSAIVGYLAIGRSLRR